MTIELPELGEGKGLTSEEVRLEFACALYARGRIGKVAAAELAGVDFFSSQRALSERSVPLYTQEMLTGDLQALKEVFPP